MKFKKPRPAIIYWRDAWQNSDRECGINAMLKAGEVNCMRYNIGFVIKRTKDYIVFIDGVIEYDDNHTVVIGQHHIPMAMVEKVKYLVEK